MASSTEGSSQWESLTKALARVHRYLDRDKMTFIMDKIEKHRLKARYRLARESKSLDPAWVKHLAVFGDKPYHLDETGTPRTENYAFPDNDTLFFDRTGPARGGEHLPDMPSSAARVEVDAVQLAKLIKDDDKLMGYRWPGRGKPGPKGDTFGESDRALSAYIDGEIAKGRSATAAATDLVDEGKVEGYTTVKDSLVKRVVKHYHQEPRK
jgi:hypothetical protein